MHRKVRLSCLASVGKLLAGEFEMNWGTLRFLGILALGCLGLSKQVQASHCGACQYPAAVVAVEQCSPVRYRVCQRVVAEEVPVTSYKAVYDTVLKEVHSMSSMFVSTPSR